MMPIDADVRKKLRGPVIATYACGEHSVDLLYGGEEFAPLLSWCSEVKLEGLCRRPSTRVHVKPANLAGWVARTEAEWERLEASFYAPIIRQLEKRLERCELCGGDASLPGSAHHDTASLAGTIHACPACAADKNNQCPRCGGQPFHKNDCPECG